ncbi:conserved hypothetical protein [uncultured Desulfobacterium sp.]|uniref:Phage tail assembly protein n=1 Tax=uncultured Desulfobacterium sp. TaxID=201089 RepID=A0A445MWH4_9BACT|nr:conserved hypothetical protein [uncultured Desulfobacterium sp.]
MNQELPIKIDLSFPISVFGEEVRELNIKRRPTTKDLKVMDSEKGEVSKTAALISRLCDVPPGSVDQLDASDFSKAAEVVSGFLG